MKQRMRRAVKSPTQDKTPRCGENARSGRMERIIMDQWNEKQIKIFQIVAAAGMAALTIAVLWISVGKEGLWISAVIIPFALSLMLPKYLEERKGMDITLYRKTLVITMIIGIAIIFVYGIITGQAF